MYLPELPTAADWPATQTVKQVYSSPEGEEQIPPYSLLF